MSTDRIESGPLTDIHGMVAGGQDAIANDRHPDDDAVDRFAAMMKAKLAQARAKGRAGWQTCPPDALQHMLVEHVHKGDPVDVANFCMFLGVRRECTALDESAVYEAIGYWPGVAADDTRRAQQSWSYARVVVAAERLQRRGFFESVSCADAQTRADMAMMRGALATLAALKAGAT